MFLSLVFVSECYASNIWRYTDKTRINILEQIQSRDSQEECKLFIRSHRHFLHSYQACYKNRHILLRIDLLTICQYTPGTRTVRFRILLSKYSPLFLIYIQLWHRVRNKKQQALLLYGFTSSGCTVTTVNYFPAHPEVCYSSNTSAICRWLQLFIY